MAVAAAGAGRAAPTYVASSDAPALGASLRALDAFRRRRGEMLERIGFGPVRTPSRTVFTTRSARLVAYGDRSPSAPAVLVVPAPIKTAYIWDLAPQASAVRALLAGGLQVYLVEWLRPQPGDAVLGLRHYADEALATLADVVRRETAQPSVVLAGHSLGGTLAAIFASLHPARVRGLVLLESPIAFGAGRLEAAVGAMPSLPALARTLGTVPGSLLTLASALSDPDEFAVEPLVDAWTAAPMPHARRLHWQVRRWSLDEAPMAGALFCEVTGALLRDNAFAKRELVVGDRLADPHAITSPVLAVADPRSRVVPLVSVSAVETLTRSGDVTILRYDGDAGVMLQHVGALVGPRAQRTLWPAIIDWIERRARRRGHTRDGSRSR